MVIMESHRAAGVEAEGDAIMMFIKAENIRNAFCVPRGRDEAVRLGAAYVHIVTISNNNLTNLCLPLMNSKQASRRSAGQSRAAH
jgi:hypothetical protein